MFLLILELRDHRILLSQIFLYISEWVKARKVDFRVDLKQEMHKTPFEVNENIKKSSFWSSRTVRNSSAMHFSSYLMSLNGSSMYFSSYLMYMVYAHGTCTWYMDMVHGTCTWHMYMVHVHGT